MAISKHSSIRDNVIASAVGPLNRQGQRRSGWWRTKRPGCPLAFLLVLLAVPQTRADLIVQQPLDPASSGRFSNLGPSNQQIADDFQLPVATTLESISWSGRYDAALSLTNPVAFSLRFFADAGGSPSVSPLQIYDVTVDAQTTGLTFGTVPWFSYSTSLPALTLNPGTYWVSVVESDPRTPTSGSSQWLWGNSSSSGLTAFRSSDGTAWTPSTAGRNIAFQLSGSVVPEPSSLLLTGVGAVVLLSCRWRDVVVRVVKARCSCPVRSFGAGGWHWR